MADDLHYVLGDYYMICERTGFKVRAAKMRQEWTGRMIRSKSFEMRHPQDFVRGIADDQKVPISRPRQADQFLGPLQTTLSAAAAAGTQTLNVASTSGMASSDKLNVMLDTGVNAQVTINLVISSTQLTITQKLPYSAASGNLVTDYSEVTAANIG